MTQPRYDDGGPAFPVSEWNWLHGMHLRDWFAGQALVGLAPLECTSEIIAKSAYQLADAMIAARALIEKDSQP